MGNKPIRKSRKEVTISSQAGAVTTDELITTFHSPESSTIVGASYDPESETLCVEFREQLATYHYDKVPRLLWEDFLSAPSKGKFFSTRIRPLFSGTRVN